MLFKPSLLLLLTLFLGLLVFCPVTVDAAKKKKKQWTAAELEALEKAWEAGDSEEELDTPERRFKKEREARDKAPPAAAAGGAPTMDGMPDMGAMGGMPPMMGGGGTGPAMMFVELLPEKAPDGVAWKSSDVETLTKAWRGLLMSGGVSAQVYNLDDKVLVNIERNLLTDCNEFLLEQPEVDYLTLDSRQIYPKGRKKKN